MIKKYNTYINEGVKDKPKFFNIKDVFDKFPGSISIAEKELQNLVIGELCVWYVVGSSSLKKQVVSEVEIRKFHQVYFNGFHVNADYSIEIEQKSKEDNSLRTTIDDEIQSYIDKLKNGRPKKHEIVGFPTGEVLYVTRDEMQKLLDNGLVRYEKWMKWRDTDYKDIYFFRDQVYHQIRKVLDDTYKKPIKSNVEEKDEYDIGDVVVCTGSSGRLVLEDRIGKIVDKVKKPKEQDYSYLVSFLMKFSFYLLDGNKWWMKENNIKGLYTGDIQTQIQLAKLQDKRQPPPEVEKFMSDFLEEHEIDDDYHLKQLFKSGANKVVIDQGNDNIKTIEPKPMSIQSDDYEDEEEMDQQND